MPESLTASLVYAILRRMTKEEALEINAELIRRAKFHTGGNAHEWKFKRCALCCNEIHLGQEYLTFIPMDYKRWTKLETKILHINCLDFKDRNSYNYNRHRAEDADPEDLLTGDWIYDIIQEKETNG